MAINSSSMRIAMIGLLGAAILSAGCRRPGAGGGAGMGGFTDIGGPTAFGSGEIPLGDRPLDPGNLVRDVAFASVEFAYDSFQVADTEVQKIQAVADYMRRNGSTRLVVEGHCDERGSREYNLSLGEHRALAVRAHLVGIGIEGSRIQTKSFGEEMPLDPGHDENAWWANRRAEFKLYR